MRRSNQWMGRLTLTALLLQAMVPLGTMPVSIGDGGFLAFCPDQTPIAALVGASADGRHHGHHHHHGLHDLATEASGVSWSDGEDASLAMGECVYASTLPILALALLALPFGLRQRRSERFAPCQCAVRICGKRERSHPPRGPPAT